MPKRFNLQLNFSVHVTIAFGAENRLAVLLPAHKGLHSPTGTWWGPLIFQNLGLLSDIKFSRFRCQQEKPKEQLWFNIWLIQYVIGGKSTKTFHYRKPIVGRGRELGEEQEWMLAPLYTQHPHRESREHWGGHIPRPRDTVPAWD